MKTAKNEARRLMVSFAPMHTALSRQGKVNAIQAVEMKLGTKGIRKREERFYSKVLKYLKQTRFPLTF